MDYRELIKSILLGITGREPDTFASRMSGGVGGAMGPGAGAMARAAGLSHLGGSSSYAKTPASKSFDVDLGVFDGVPSPATPIPLNYDPAPPQHQPMPGPGLDGSYLPPPLRRERGAIGWNQTDGRQLFRMGY